MYQLINNNKLRVEQIFRCLTWLSVITFSLALCCSAAFSQSGDSSGASSQEAPAVATPVSSVATGAENDVAKDSLSAVITEVKGKHVQYSTDGGQTWQKAAVNIKLKRNDAVRTGFGSSCELNFGGHSVVQVEALSSLKVDDYAATAQGEKVRAKLRYGAVRCGVERGRVKADTRISTPVSTLSIRGTLVYVEYDSGTRRCKLQVDDHGPAWASAAAWRWGSGCEDCDEDENNNEEAPQSEQSAASADEPNQPGVYVLEEGMRTDCSLSRYLDMAVFERTVWVNGNYNIGDVSEPEKNAIIFNTVQTDPGEGALQYDDKKSGSGMSRMPFEIEFPEGDIPIGS
ncbi:MAG: FecR domain-containing protein [Sedimentisphaerales bacterium]|nr:FecR domain-containing protein [Sedimentisphaerales bacterium]